MSTEVALSGIGAAPNLLALGLDVVEVDRIRQAIDRTPGLVDRAFTPAEIGYAREARDPAERFAVRWAAKEAVVKTLGGGVPGLDLREIEVRRGADGAPHIEVRGHVGDLAVSRGFDSWLVSLSHTATIAQAIVAALGHAPAADGR